MKTMTCRDMGGSCDVQITGNTAEEMMNNGSAHVKEMASSGDEEHKKVLVMMDEMQKKDFIHYEISNFCKEGFYSKHNSNYWKGANYLGLGPSAHSFDGLSRQWNLSSNSKYIASLQNNILPFEKEILSESQKYNEYVMTSLRTIWGADENFVKKNFSSDIYSLFLELTMKEEQKKLLDRNGTKRILTRKGKLFADQVAANLFLV